MPEPALAPAAVATTWLLTYLLHSSALIAGAWLLTRLAALQPRTRDFLWRVALLGGVATATGTLAAPDPPHEVAVVRRIASDLDVRREELPLAAVDHFVRRSEPPATDPLLSWSADAADGAGPGRVRLHAELTEADVACRDLARSPGAGGPEWVGRLEVVCARGALRWYHGLLLVWTLGAGLALVPLARSRRELGRLLASLHEPGARTRRLLAEVAGGFGPVSVRSSPALAAPCALPGATIGVPSRCEDELSDAELRAALAHELAHVSRRDVRWSGLLRALTAVLWVQPLNRLALRRAEEAAELTCDDWALARTGDRVGLATSISRVAEWVSLGGGAEAVAVSMAGGEGALSERVRRILSGTTPREPSWLRGVVALLIAAPLLWIPDVPSPTPVYAAIRIEERMVTDVGLAVRPDRATLTEVGQRVFIARLRSDD